MFDGNQLVLSLPHAHSLYVFSLSFFLLLYFFCVACPFSSLSFCPDKNGMFQYLAELTTVIRNKNSADKQQVHFILDYLNGLIFNQSVLQDDNSRTIKEQEY